MKNHPYIIAILSATVLAAVVWVCMPKEYAAMTKVCDEYKETELAIGLDKLSVSLKQMTENTNKGINDIEVYSRILDTKLFAKRMSETRIERKGMTYGEWVASDRHFLDNKDTLEIILDNISYNNIVRQHALEISLKDKDPEVASLMLDTLIANLQNQITVTRQQHNRAVQADAQLNVERLERDYVAKSIEYAMFVDSHRQISDKQNLTKRDKLKKECNIIKEQLEKAKEHLVRQYFLTMREKFSFAIVQINTVPVEDTSHPIAYFGILIIVFVVTVKTAKLYQQRKKEHAKVEIGGIFSPWFITIGVWGGIAVLFVISGDLLDPLTDQFYIAISIWLSVFLTTSFVTFNLLKHDTRHMPVDGININRIAFYFLLTVALIFSPMYMYEVWQTVSAFDSKDMMNNMRLLAVHGEGHGFLNYALVVSQSLLLVSLWRYPKMPRWQLTAVILCCILNSIAIMEKGTFFLVVLCSMYVMFEKRIIKVRTIVIIGCLTVFAFYIFNLMRQGEDSEYSKNESLMDFIAMYIMSPLVAFCKVNPEVTNQFGTNTFEVIYLFLNRFGIGNFEVHEKLQEFVHVPIPTNVYTIMQPFYRDFGYYGVAFFAWVYGIISGILYRYSCNGKPFAICLYTYMVEVLVLQFFQENLFLTMVFVVQLVFFVFLITQNTISITIRRTVKKRTNL